MNKRSPNPYRSGFVTVMGRPNVGKSTLINRLIGQKIAAVSPRPQTTRARQLGILTTDQFQIIFIDTPGVHQARSKLGEIMNQQAREALEDADLVLLILDASQVPTSEDHQLAELIQTADRQADTLLALNKIDLVSSVSDDLLDAFQSLVPQARLLTLSATRGDNCLELLEIITASLPEGPQYFSEDQVTDLYERDITADLIREAALIHLRDEVPHGIAIRIDEYKDRDEHTAYIAATLLLEKEAHKPIVIGKNGDMIKQIGMSARQEIEAMTGRKVFLELKVKVRKNWRDDETVLKSLGFTRRT